MLHKPLILLRRSTCLGRRGSGVQIAPPRPFVNNSFICNLRLGVAGLHCCHLWRLGALASRKRLHFRLQGKNEPSSLGCVLWTSSEKARYEFIHTCPY